jgi:hypothetical protein
MGRQMRMGQVRITVSTWLRPLWQPIEQELLRSRLNDAHSLYASNGRGIRSNQRNRVSHPAAAPRARRTVFNPPLPQRLSRAWPSVEVVGVVGLGPFTSSQPCHSGSHPTLSRPPAYYCDPRLRLALSHFGAVACLIVEVVLPIRPCLKRTTTSRRLPERSNSSIAREPAGQRLARWARSGDPAQSRPPRRGARNRTLPSRPCGWAEYNGY